MLLRINKFLPFTRVEGPGERACIWVQGCPIHCPGCAVPWTWSENGGKVVDTEELAQRILNGQQIEGVTFVGGEPFAQAEALAHLGHILQDSGLSIVTFTGYILEDILNSSRQDWHDLLSVTDLLIDGPYRQDFADVSRPWVGSSNQRYHFLTPRYRHLESSLSNIPNRIEVRLHPDGRIFINGMASAEDLEDLFTH
ncbi:MAG: 4Fe-4S single cluster domain-containing protein [Xenococcaceae cyanobacterium]